MSRRPVTLVYRRGEETSHELREADGAEVFTDPDDDGPRPGLKRLVSTALGYAEVFTVTVEVPDMEDLGRSLGQIVHNLADLVGAGVSVQVGGEVPVWFFDAEAGAQPPLSAGRPATAAQALALLDEVRRAGASRRAKHGVEGARKRGRRLGAPRLLGTEQVQWARERSGEGTSFAALGAQLGVSAQTVARAIRASTEHDVGVSAPHREQDAPDEPTSHKEVRGDPRPVEPGGPVEPATRDKQRGEHR